MELEIICEEPYEPISNEKFEKALHELRTSDVVIYTDFPVGQTNILNKKLVEHAINTNKKVIKYDGNIKSLKEMLE